MKNVPSGLQATGQYEQDDYEQTLKDIQEEYLDNLLVKHYELDIASSYPDREDLKVEVEWNPIQLPKAAEVQQIESQKASEVCQLVQTGIITITEARAKLREGEKSAFAFLSGETPELLKKLEQQKDAEKQQELQMKAQRAQMAAQGGMPGASGAPEQQPTNPQFEANKNVFQEVLKEVQGGEGMGDSEQQSPATPEGKHESSGEQPQNQGEKKS